MTGEHSCNVKTGFEMCVNLIGSYFCDCIGGYEMLSGRSDCQGIYVVSTNFRVKVIMHQQQLGM